MPSVIEEEGEATTYVLRQLRKINIPAFYDKCTPEEAPQLDYMYTSFFQPDKQFFKTYLNYLIYVITMAAKGIIPREDVWITETSVELSDDTVIEVYHEFLRNWQQIVTWHFETLN